VQKSHLLSLLDRFDVAAHLTIVKFFNIGYSGLSLPLGDIMFNKYALIALLATNTFLWGEETSSSYKQYITSDQVTVTESGILVFLKGNIQPVKAQMLSYDEEGMFVMIQGTESVNGSFEKGPCGLHRVWHRECGGCGVLFCPMNCTCFD
jgi:hypothetical protein